MFHKLLVAVDKTEMDQHVFDEAVSLAKATGAHLMFMHVFYPFDEQFFNADFVEPHVFYPTSYQEANNEYVKHWEKIKQEGIDFLTSLSSQASAEGLDTEYKLEAGDPGRMICQVARNWEADLIIVGRRGHMGLTEFFLGSVSNYVLHHAPCSVLTVQGFISSTTPDVADVPSVSASS